jgi:hypothetical protein
MSAIRHGWFWLGTMVPRDLSMIATEVLQVPWVLSGKNSDFHCMVAVGVIEFHLAVTAADFVRRLPWCLVSSASFLNLCLFLVLWAPSGGNSDSGAFAIIKGCDWLHWIQFNSMHFVQWWLRVSWSLSLSLSCEYRKARVCMCLPQVCSFSPHFHAAAVTTQHLFSSVD